MLNEGFCGYVAIVGRPNVGKSTLLNHLLGQKLSITSRKPQTTHHHLLGIKTTGNTQIIYVDTPGLHQRKHNALNRYLNRTATNSMVGVDVIVWLVEALQWMEDDNFVKKTLAKTSAPVILGINKIDKLATKKALLPYLQEVATKHKFTEIYPISARKGDNLENLESKIIQLLPVNTLLFPEDQITNRNERFLCAELVREKLVRRLGAELPYRLTVQIEHFSSEKKLTHISAIIFVERQGQKPIVIGSGGKVLKEVGEAARKDMENMLGCQVFLRLWVKVKPGWCDNERLLQQLGYQNIKPKNLML
jgi:GTP-binding protein Era